MQIPLIIHPYAHSTFVATN